jgi:DNA-binding IclR family transcriptional regulator
MARAPASEKRWTTALPILTRGLVAGVVSISAPTYRTTRQRKGQFVQLLTTAAREIGQRMEIAPVWASTSRQ